MQAKLRLLQWNSFDVRWRAWANRRGQVFSIHEPHVSIFAKVQRDVYIWFITYCNPLKDNTGNKKYFGHVGGEGKLTWSNWSTRASFKSISPEVLTVCRGKWNQPLSSSSEHSLFQFSFCHALATITSQDLEFGCTACSRHRDNYTRSTTTTAGWEGGRGDLSLRREREDGFIYIVAYASTTPYHHKH